MRLALLFLLAVSTLAQDRLPADFHIGRMQNPRYEIVEWRATLTMPSRWCSWMGCETTLPLTFDKLDFFINNQPANFTAWHSTILPGKPGCFGRQLNNPQKPFYFDDRWPLGVTLRGHAGQQIQFFCRTAADNGKQLSEEAKQKILAVANAPKRKR